ncbi:MAG: hypothetical protein LUQ50_09035 [Methanospirillum sp.]|uniref:hypothetical protein n=1 Tax=Methanospirillum sp. TaxID=45200 RepID=UPI0023713B51|nr:hypothetical protein [Methanospirillum sp.]MDD1729202.1 hypothetical protein [Methanospirillum sp.]
MTKKEPFNYNYSSDTDFHAKQQETQGVPVKDLDTEIDDEKYDTGKPYRKRIIAVKK